MFLTECCCACYPSHCVLTVREGLVWFCQCGCVLLSLPSLITEWGQLQRSVPKAGAVEVRERRALAAECLWPCSGLVIVDTYSCSVGTSVFDHLTVWFHAFSFQWFSQVLLNLHPNAVPAFLYIFHGPLCNLWSWSNAGTRQKKGAEFTKRLQTKSVSFLKYLVDASTWEDMLKTEWTWRDP